MKLLNLGCGGLIVEEEPWMNCDDAFNSDEHEKRVPKYYKKVNLTKEFPFPDNSIDGILLSHVLEHLPLHPTIRCLEECYRVLIPGGIVRISSPDPERVYNLTLQEPDFKDWGERNSQSGLPLRGSPTGYTFMQFCLFWDLHNESQHLQMLGKFDLFCLLRGAGFKQHYEMPYGKSSLQGLEKLDNRPMFSIFVEGKK